jgi:hypothetical protein
MNEKGRLLQMSDVNQRRKKEAQEHIAKAEKWYG